MHVKLIPPNRQCLSVVRSLSWFAVALGAVLVGRACAVLHCVWDFHNNTVTVNWFEHLYNVRMVCTIAPVWTCLLRLMHMCEFCAPLCAKCTFVKFVLICALYALMSARCIYVHFLHFCALSAHLCINCTIMGIEHMRACCALVCV